MKDVKLVRALSTLNKEEWMSFRKFLLSFTSAESELFSLFSLLQLRKSNFESLSSPDGFRAKHFPNLNQKAFLGMLSKIYKSFEDWLAVYELKNTEYEQQLYLIKGLFRKGLTKEAKSHAEKLKKKLTEVQTLDFNLNRLLGEIDQLVYYHKNNDSAEERHQLLISASHHNALAYKERTQFYVSELINRNKIFQYDFDEHIETLISSSSSIPDTELSKIGSSLIEVLSNQDPEHLQRIVIALVENKFKKGSDLESALISYASIKLSYLYGLGVLKKADLIYSFYNFQFQAEIEKSLGKLSQTKFHNRVDNIANFISIDKAKEFADYWIDKVDTTNRKETLELAYSQIYFIKRDFKSMVKFSRFVAFDNYGQKTRAWLHNVICLYVFRQENYDLTIQSLSAFKNYLKRNRKKYSKNYFLANFNLVVLMEKLTKNDFSPQSINLGDYKVIFYRIWISEELAKINK